MVNFHLVNINLVFVSKNVQGCGISILVDVLSSDLVAPKDLLLMGIGLDVYFMFSLNLNIILYIIHIVVNI